jgi:hypothetical protein
VRDNKERKGIGGIICKMTQHTSTPRLGTDTEITGAGRETTHKHLRVHVSPSTNKDGFDDANDILVEKQCFRNIDTPFVIFLVTCPVMYHASLAQYYTEGARQL